MALSPRIINLLPETFAICRLPSCSPVPSWSAEDGFYSITRTADELSIVCRQDAVPGDVMCERDWRCLGLAGKIDFSVVGVLASLVVPLAEAGVSVFAVSTYNTDYLLVKGKDLDRAVEVLRRQGHTVG